MRQTMMVKAVENGEALLIGRRASACGGCAGKAACGTLGSWSSRSLELRVPDRLGAKPGDMVTVEVEDGAVLRISALLYGAPVLAFLFGGAAGLWLAGQLGWAEAQGWAALAALGASAASWPAAMRLARRFSPRVRMVAIESSAQVLPSPSRVVH